MAEKPKKMCRTIDRKPGRTTAAPLNRGQQRFYRCATACLVTLLAGVPALAALTHAYSPEAGLLSQQIASTARQLVSVTRQTSFNQLHAESILAELKNLITDYERTLVIAPTAYPGEFLLGTTGPGDGGWLETLCKTTYGRPLKEIRVRRMGSAAVYLRISDIEITYVSPAGRAKCTLNRNANTKLYNEGVFKLALPRPMRVVRIRIKTSHKSNGLEVYGVPYQGPAVRAPIVEDRHPGGVLLGTTPPGDGAWLETICSVKDRRPVRQIKLTSTGTKAEYLRINDIEVTYMTPKGPMKQVFNKSGRVKLYYGGAYTLSLPKPMRIIRVRILTEHKSTGLNIYGVY